jgi:hypothetical protein
MAKKTRTELSTLALNTNLPDNTQELITPTTERAQLTDERESVVNYKDDLGGVPNAGKFLTVATDGESLTMVDEPQGDIQGSGVDGQITYWDGTKTVTSDAMLLIDTTFKFLKIVIPVANSTGGVSLNAVGASANSSLAFLNNGVTMAQLYYDNSTANLRLASDGDVEINPSGTLSVDSGATFKATTPSPVVSTPIVSIADSVNGVLGGIGALASGGYPLQIWGGTLELKTGSSSNIAAATTRLTISSGGLATFSNGIKFGGIPSPAYDVAATTLDAYEEGTWTPTLLNANGNESTEGTYTRIGNIIRVGGLIIFNTQTNTTQLTIQSFPFQVGSINEGTRGGVSVGYSTSSTYYTILMDSGSTQARVWGQGATGNPTLASLSGTRVYFGGTYQV